MIGGRREVRAPPGATVVPGGGLSGSTPELVTVLDRTPFKTVTNSGVDSDQGARGQRPTPATGAPGCGAHVCPNRYDPECRR